MIRGLNDNASGGLGGFATICMVTSLVQNLPSHKNHNLGELLIEFFNLYGNLLNVQDVGIRLDPPGYLSKVHDIPESLMNQSCSPNVRLTENSSSYA